MFSLSRTTVIATLTLLTSSCYAESSLQPEPLFSIQFQKEAAIFQVRSNGCTRAAHFLIEKVEKNALQNSVRITRTVPDRCRAKPRPMTITLPYDTQANQTTYVLNPFSSRIQQKSVERQ